MSRALVLRSTVALILVIAFVAMALTFTMPREFRSFAVAAMQPEPQPPTADDLASLLLRLDFGPKALAAAGLTPSEAADFISAVTQAISPSATTLGQLDQEIASDRLKVDHLRRLVRSGQADDADRKALAAATASLNEGEASRQSILNALYDLTFELLTAEQAQRLAQIRSNRMWRLPIEYLVETRTQQEWLMLREALANKRIAGQIGEEPDEQAQLIIGQANASSSVTMAKANLEMNLASIYLAWETSLETQ